MQRAIDNPTNKREDSDQALREQGFTVERKGSFTIYRRPVSQDTLEASRLFSYKRRIGYTSTDIPGKRCK